MGEIIAVRHGRSGGRLIDAGGRIHDASESTPEVSARDTPNRSAGRDPS